VPSLDLKFDDLSNKAHTDNDMSKEESEEEESKSDEVKEVLIEKPPTIQVRVSLPQAWAIRNSRIL
jgi:hypothetical protein